MRSAARSPCSSPPPTSQNAYSQPTVHRSGSWYTPAPSLLAHDAIPIIQSTACTGHATDTFRASHSTCLTGFSGPFSMSRRGDLGSHSVLRLCNQSEWERRGRSQSGERGGNPDKSFPVWATRHGPLPGRPTSSRLFLGYSMQRLYAMPKLSHAAQTLDCRSMDAL